MRQRNVWFSGAGGDGWVSGRVRWRGLLIWHGEPRRFAGGRGGNFAILRNVCHGGFNNQVVGRINKVEGSLYDSYCYVEIRSSLYLRGREA